MKWFCLVMDDQLTKLLSVCIAKVNFFLLNLIGPLLMMLCGL